MESLVWQKAVVLAAQAHQFQKRKDGKTPYISHPMRVAMTLSLIFHVEDPTILSAALLHDVIEDTATDYDDVLEVCGKDVADLVASLSKDTRIEYTQRELEYQAQLDRADWRTKIIKLADLYDNICDAVMTHSKINVWTPAEHAIAAAQEIPELAQPAALLAQLLEKYADVRQELQK